MEAAAVLFYGGLLELQDLNMEINPFYTLANITQINWNFLSFLGNSVLIFIDTAE